MSPAGGAGQPARTTEAFEAAYYHLLHALACGLQALKDPACVRTIGPVVPGAMMAHGARVPGTSFNLDPVQAAFSIGTMLHWLDDTDPSPGEARGRPAAALGGILAVADYLSRKAIAEGRPPFTVRDVLRSMLQAHSIQRIVASTAAADADTLATVDLQPAARVATAAVVASLLGGTREQVVNAVLMAQAGGQSMPQAGRAAADAGWCHRWAWGDAMSGGVRVALLAVNGAQEASISATPVAIAIAHVLLQEDVGDSPAIPRPEQPEPNDRTRERFEVCVAAHFPPAQAKKIQVLFADPTRLAETAVQEFGSALVKN